MVRNILEANSEIPSRQPFCFPWDELATVANSKWSGSDLEFSKLNGVSSICTDSRSLSADALFLALRGHKFDGHEFIIDAASKNVAAVCAEQLSDNQAKCLHDSAIPYLLVCDTLKAYQKIAYAYRRRFDLPVVAVTGSTGKTSTKEIIAAILKQHFGEYVLLTDGNTNNQIGVPQNLLKLTHEHRAAVLELGTNLPGEIKTLTDLVRPDCAVLTNVGPVHLEGLQSIEGVLNEKSDIFSNLKNGRGCAVIPASLRHHPLIISRIQGMRTLTFGIEEDADIRMVYLGGDFDCSRFVITDQRETKPLRVTWNLSGVHQALNAAAAVAVARFLRISDQTILNALESSRLPGMRMEVGWKNNIRWINDAYNANPESMKAFVDWLSTVKLEESNVGRFYVVLGDMFELGAAEERYHREVLDYVSEKLPNMVPLPVGERMSRAAGKLGIPSFFHVGDVKKWVFDRLEQGDSVALKGSRGMALEQIIP